MSQFLVNDQLGWLLVFGHLLHASMNSWFCDNDLSCNVSTLHHFLQWRFDNQTSFIIWDLTLFIDHSMVSSFRRLLRWRSLIRLMASAFPFMSCDSRPKSPLAAQSQSFRRDSCAIHISFCRSRWTRKTQEEGWDNFVGFGSEYTEAAGWSSRFLFRMTRPAGDDKK